MVLDPIKVAILGASGVGKTALLQSFLTAKPAEGPFEPTILDYHAHIVADKKKNKITVEVLDTSGQDQNKNTRRLALDGAEVIVMCFALNERTSLTFIQNVLMAEIPVPQSLRARIPIVLVGTKSDVRNTGLTFKNLLSSVASGGEPCLIPATDGEALKQAIGATTYIECSALTADCIKNVFEEAIRCVLNLRASKRSLLNLFGGKQQKFEGIRYHSKLNLGPQNLSNDSIMPEDNEEEEEEEEVEDKPLASNETNPVPPTTAIPPSSPSTSQIPTIIEPKRKKSTAPKPKSSLHHAFSVSHISTRSDESPASKHLRSFSEQETSSSATNSSPATLSPHVIASSRYQRRRSSSMSETDLEAPSRPPPVNPNVVVKRKPVPLPKPNLVRSQSSATLASTLPPPSPSTPTNDNSTLSKPTHAVGIVRTFSSLDIKFYDDISSTETEQTRSSASSASSEDASSKSTSPNLLTRSTATRPLPQIPVVTVVETAEVDEPDALPLDSPRFTRRRSSSVPDSTIPIPRPMITPKSKPPPPPVKPKIIAAK